MRDRLIACVCVCAWLLAVAIAFQPLFAYQSSPGKFGSIQKIWPASSKLKRIHNEDTIVMFVHPKCPCTRATLEQLNRLSAFGGERFNAIIVFQQPKGYGDSWIKGPMWDRVSAIRGARCVIDSEQREAKLFGSNTSGDTFVYNKNGSLLFHGGITAGRGHEGDCPGFKALRAILLDQKSNIAHVPSFGCELFNR